MAAKSKKMLKKIPAIIWLVLGAAILFLPFLGSTHLFDWDEVNFAEASREMLITKNYFIPQINFQPFWEKPPLFFWLQASSMSVFGVNEFAARFPNALCGMITLICLYRIGKRLRDKTLGWIWVLMYAGSFLPQLYFKSAIIDPWFNLFIFLSLYHLAFYTEVPDTKQGRRIFYSGLFAGLAVLTKGPVALLIIGLVYGIYQLAHRFGNFLKARHLLLFLVVMAMIGGVWFVALSLGGFQNVIVDFIKYQVSLFATSEADQTGPFFYHFIVLLFGCFPAVALCILAMRRYKKIQLSFNFQQWMMILFWVVLILFSIVRTKIVHYSSLCYLPLTFFAALCFDGVYRQQWRMPSWSRWLQLGTGLFLALLIIGITYVNQWRDPLIRSGLVHDDFAKAAMKADVAWSGWEKIPGFLLLAGLLVFFYDVRLKPKTALFILFFSTMAAVNGTILLITPKIEPYSQGAAVEFYQSKAREEPVIETIGFKSYAQLYYGQRIPSLGKTRADSIIRYGTDPGVPCYFVGKIQNRENDKKDNPRLQELYTKNGFVFYRLNRE